MWVLGHAETEYAAAQPLLATKDIDLLIFCREELGPLSHQILETSVEQLGAPGLLIVGDSYLVEKSMVLDFLKVAPEVWSETQVKAKDTAELIELLGLHFVDTDLNTKIELNKTKNSVEINGKIIKLTSREFEILDHLLIAPEHIVARADFFNSVWSGLKVCNKVLDVHVSNLRKKVQPHGIKIRFVRPGSFEIVLPETITDKHPKPLPEAI